MEPTLPVPVNAAISKYQAHDPIRSLIRIQQNGRTLSEEATFALAIMYFPEDSLFFRKRK